MKCLVVIVILFICLPSCRHERRYDYTFAVDSADSAAARIYAEKITPKSSVPPKSERVIKISIYILVSLIFFLT